MVMVSPCTHVMFIATYNFVCVKVTALCACELRSPAAVDEKEFIIFKRHYVTTLAEWGLFRHEFKRVAHCNLIPDRENPATSSLYAFSYTLPCNTTSTVPDFIKSVTAECPDHPGYLQHIVRRGKTSPDMLTEKVKVSKIIAQCLFLP